jgi:hypothetical protein
MPNPPIKCFLLAETKIVEKTIQAYGGDCPKGLGHRCTSVVERGELPVDQKLEIDYRLYPTWPKDVPMVCEDCGIDMSSGVVFSLSWGAGRLWSRVDTGEIKRRIQDFGVGAMWRSSWYPLTMYWDNATESPLLVCTPGGDWNIDSRCSNCTLKDDRTHRCWVRHGEPPNITVDKNGKTCSAGAGSIQAGSWHGFLRNGFLVC